MHIKVRMPELVRKHKLHKHHHLPHQYYLNLHKPYYQPQQHAQHQNQAVKHGRRAVKPTPPTPPLMSHNHHDMGVYGDELTASGVPEHLLYSSGGPRPISVDLTPNYGPALFGGASGGSNNENMQQRGNPLMTGMLTMPGGTQQLVQHIELMGALAAAMAASGGASGEEEDANSGGGATETNTLLSDDFLADLEHTYANGKYPAASLRRKKKYRGAGLAEIGDAAATFTLNSPPQQQQSAQLQHQQQFQLMRQQYQQQQKQLQKHQQQFYGRNYFVQQAKPQAQMLRAPPTISSNNNYHNYHQHMHYKNKHQYSNNDIYPTSTSDEDNDTNVEEVEDTNDGDSGDDDHDDHDDDFDSDVSLFFSSRPLSTTALSPSTTAYNSANDYDDDVEQFDYNYHMNNYFDGVEGDAKLGVNTVSYQPTTAYGAYTIIPSTPAAATQHKMRPYRQSQQQQHKHSQQHRYTATQPFQISGHQQLQPQQQQLITTAEPINVIGPTASEFDDQQTPPTQQHQKQLHHKYTVSPRNKKRKNRIKGKLHRNRILKQ